MTKAKQADGFERRKEQSRESILRATEELVSKYGLDKFSVAEIARQAGVSQVTIYNLFGSKDSLIHETVKIVADRLLGRFEELLKTDEPPLEKLENIFSFAQEINEAYPGFNSVETLGSPQLQHVADGVWKKEGDLFLQFVKNGQQRGYLNPELSDEAVKVYFEFIMKGFLSDPELHARTHRDPRLTHDLLMIVFYGFGKK